MAKSIAIFTKDGIVAVWGERKAARDHMKGLTGLGQDNISYASDNEEDFFTISSFITKDGCGLVQAIRKFETGFSS